ncbi:MAG: hypothetical protein HY887_10045 [Deltaproteobacteria bacterium]|nr:hypothetical protein [Deltaproteobacteria bacterium]
MEKADIVKVFIASPGDLSEERKLFPEIIKLINDSRENHQSPCYLKPVGWEDTLPGFGRPQELIN